MALRTLEDGGLFRAGATVPAAECALRDLRLARRIAHVTPSESLPDFLDRIHGGFDITLYRTILGMADEYKEGDEMIGIATTDAASHANARQLLENTSVGFVVAHPPFRDSLSDRIARTTDRKILAEVTLWTFGQLKEFLLRENEEAIRVLMPGLGSDVIACVVKLLSESELIAIGGKIFNPLACPVYRRARPTKQDPMLNYMATSFQDHVRLRKKFGLRVEERMENFYRRLGILVANGEFPEHAADPI